MHEKGEHMSKDDLLLLIQAVRAEDRDKQEMKAMLKDILERLVRIEARLEKRVEARAQCARTLRQAEWSRGGDEEDRAVARDTVQADQAGRLPGRKPATRPEIHPVGQR